jgi:hypothetical protein
MTRLHRAIGGALVACLAVAMSAAADVAVVSVRPTRAAHGQPVALTIGAGDARMIGRSP